MGRIGLARKGVGRLVLAREEVGRPRLARECEYRLGLASEGVGRKSLALVGTLALLLRQKYILHEWTVQDTTRRLTPMKNFGKKKT